MHRNDPKKPVEALETEQFYVAENGPPELADGDVTQKYLYTYPTNNKKKNKHEIIHFSQDELCQIVVDSPDQYAELNDLILKFNGLCEIVSNHVMFRDMLGKKRGDTLLDELMASSSSKLELTEKGELQHAAQPEHKIDIDNINALRDTHILKVSSTFKVYLALAFQIYPYSILNPLQQRKINNGTKVNADVLAKSLEKIKPGDYVKVHAASVVEGSLKGHSCCIKKTGDNSYSFFDPNVGETQNLSSKELADKLSSLMWTWKANKLILQDGREYMKMLHRRQSSTPGEMQPEQKKEAQPASNQTAKTAATDSHPVELVLQKLFSCRKGDQLDIMVGKIHEAGICQDDPLINNIIKILRCDNVHNLDRDMLNQTIDKLNSWISNHFMVKNNGGFIPALEIMQKYLAYHDSKGSDSESTAKEAFVTAINTTSSNTDTVPLIWLPHAELSDIKFEAGINLRQANLKNARLQGVELKQARLFACDLEGAVISGCNFSETYISDSRLIRTHIEDTNLESATISALAGKVVDKFRVNDDCTLHNCKINLEVMAIGNTATDASGYYDMLFSNLSESDFLPKNWLSDNNAFNNYLEEHFNDYSYPNRMNIIVNIIRNLENSDLSSKDKCNLLKDIVENRLKTNRRLGIFKRKSDPRTEACKKVLNDEIAKIKKMGHRATQDTPQPKSRN